jgi:hypothetical protein
MNYTTAKLVLSCLFHYKNTSHFTLLHFTWFYFTSNLSACRLKKLSASSILNCYFHYEYTTAKLVLTCLFHYKNTSHFTSLYFYSQCNLPVFLKTNWLNIYNWFTKAPFPNLPTELIEVVVEVKLRPTISQPAFLVIGLPSGAHYQIFVFCLTIAGFLLWGALSDERRVCNLLIQLSVMWSVSLIH